MSVDQPFYNSMPRYRVEEVESGLQLDLFESSDPKDHPSAPMLFGTVISEGGRNNMLASLAGSLRWAGASQEEILAQLLIQNAATCSPPLEDDEVAGIAASYAKYPTHSFDLNDTGNANRLVRNFGTEIRFVHRWGKWLHWDGHQWKQDDSGRIVECAKDTSRLIIKEAHQVHPRVAKQIIGHANSSLQKNRINAMIDLAQSCPGIPIDVNKLDSHPKLLTVPNGVLDLSTGGIRPANPADMITRSSPVVFDPNASCPTFCNFIKDVTCGDAAFADYLQRLAGYCLSGDTSAQVMFFLYGSGANGKSTFLNVIRELLGDELSHQCPTQTLMIQRHGRGASNDLARLVAVRVAIGTEIEEGSHFDEPLIKQMTGGEPITARFLYSEFFEYMPQFKLLIAGNHRPVIKGDDEGIWRRIQLIPFLANIPSPQRDPRLMEKLRAELPGILNWALVGFRQWEAIGLAPPKVVTDASKEYRDEMDILADWINDQCVTGPTCQEGSKKLFNNYKLWCFTMGYRPATHNSFNRKLEARFRKRRTAAGMVFDDIKLK